MENTNGNRIPTFWYQMTQKNGGTTKIANSIFFSCSFLSIFLYGEEAFLKDYLYLFSKTYSHNKVEKFQKIL